MEDPADRVVPNALLDFADLHPGHGGPAGPAPGVQRAPSGMPVPVPIISAEGLRIGLGGGGVPPDPTGDVGTQHYMQWVNTSWALFAKSSGARVSGPTAGNSFWLGFGGLCESVNAGDPLVLYDDAAPRRVVSQFAHPSAAVGLFLKCVAVSSSADPLGSYYRYAFEYPRFNDYGKIGVWASRDGGQNAYLFTMHEFSGGAFRAAPSPPSSATACWSARAPSSCSSLPPRTTAHCPCIWRACIRCPTAPVRCSCISAATGPVTNSGTRAWTGRPAVRISARRRVSSPRSLSGSVCMAFRSAIRPSGSTISAPTACIAR